MHDPQIIRIIRLLAAQVLLGLLLSGASLLFGWPVARDVLIGGFAAVLGSALLALWIFGRSRTVDPQVLVKRFYAAELLKWAGIVIVFGVAMKKVAGLNPLMMLAAFAFVQTIPLLLVNKIAR